MGKMKVADFLYPWHLCRRVYSFRFSVRLFVRLFVRSFVRSLVRSLFRNVRGIYVKVFVKVSLVVSHEPMIKNHSYFTHRYPIGFALFLCVRTLGPCPGVGLEVKI